jgi:hypothetical protein
MSYTVPSWKARPDRVPMHLVFTGKSALALRTQEERKSSTHMLVSFGFQGMLS